MAPVNLGPTALLRKRKIGYSLHMKKKITLLAGLLFLFPAWADAQPKAARWFQKTAKTKPLSERAAARAAKEKHLKKARPKPRPSVQGEQAERFQLKEALANLIERNPDDIIAALHQMRKMRLKRGAEGNPEYFQQFATIYYKKHLKTLTPHMYEFFGQVGKRHSNSLEKDVILRMRYLFARRDAILSAWRNSPGGVDRLRLRYLKHVDKLDDRNFNPEALIFSYEHKLTSFTEPVAIRHINMGSKFYIGRNKVPVAGFDYDISYITELYKYLLNKDGSADGITAVFDPASRQIALYSPDRTVWIRVTPHEYASVNRLHVHLNQTRTIQYKDAGGNNRTEMMLINMSIPIMPSAAINPKNKRPYNLYEKLILAPIRLLEKDPGAKVIKGPIF